MSDRVCIVPTSKSATVLLLSFLACVYLLGLPVRSRAEDDVVPGEVLVGVQAATDSARPNGMFSDVGQELGHHVGLHAYRIKLRAGLSLETALSTLQHRQGVTYAEPNRILHAASTPNDPSYSSQWAPQKVQADMAWGLWNPQQQVIIAIVDSGIDNTHPDLTNKILRDTSGNIIGYNALTSATGAASDDNGHGTHCAGIAAAQIDNGVGIAGIAGWNGQAGQSDTTYIKLMPVKALDNTGSGTTASVASGITWAADHGAKVISLSLGSSGYSSTLDTATTYAWNKGCVVVAAAGNSGVPTKFYPAANANVVSVAATDSGDNLASFSNWGTWVMVAAPGVSIYSTLPTYPAGGNFGTNYGTLSGTSMATPHVAGEAALIMAQNPALTNTQVVNLITTNVDAYHPYGSNTIAATAGRINVLKALQAAGGNPQTVVLSSLALAPNTIVGGNTSIGTLTLSDVAPSGGAIVNVTSSNACASVPTTVTIPAGQMTGTFNIPTQSVTTNTPATITASYNNSNQAPTLTVIPTSSTTATVSFVKTDTTTQGNWKGVYGGQGYNVINDTTNYPSYATVGVLNNLSYTWAASTADARALQKANASDRIAACWYSGSNFTIDLNLTDGLSHQIAIYTLDWESAGRAERFDITDVGSGALLDSETDSAFASVGKFEVWNIKGHVQIKVTCTGGSNAVVSGLFFDAASGSGTNQPPGAPTGLTATAGNAQVSLSWSASTGATSYNVKRSTTSGGPYTTISTAGAVTGTSYTDSTVTNGTTYYYVVTAVNSAGESGNSNQASATPSGGSSGTASATFIKTDTTTQGNWKGVYGGQGYNVINDTTNYPSYATVSVSGNSNYTWASSTADVRALQKASASDRIAACWYSGSNFTIDLNLTDGLSHQIALYCLDWENAGRAERIDITDASSGAVLDSENASAFALNGKYEVWNIKGHVKIKVTFTGGQNAVLSGLFFDAASGSGTNQPPGAPTGLTATAGNAQVSLSWSASTGATSYNVKRSTTSGGPYTTISTAGAVTGTSYTDSTVTNGTTYYYVVTAVNSAGESGNSNQASATPSGGSSGTASATFIKTDTTTQGNWKGVYGSKGYNVLGDGVSYPSYATVSASGNASYTWAATTYDPRALIKVNAPDHVAACWYSSSSFTIDLNLTDGLSHQVGFYLLDWENAGRSERVDILDASSGAVLSTQNASAFTSGDYLVWSIKGHVQIKFTLTGGSNAVVSGLFFD